MIKQAVRTGLGVASAFPGETHTNGHICLVNRTSGAALRVAFPGRSTPKSHPRKADPSQRSTPRPPLLPLHIEVAVLSAWPLPGSGSSRRGVPGFSPHIFSGHPFLRQYWCDCSDSLVSISGFVRKKTFE